MVWDQGRGVDTAPVVRFAQSGGARLAQCLQGCPLLVAGDCCSGADADVSCRHGRHSYSWGPQGLPRLYTICIQQQPTFTSQPSTVPTTVS